MTNVRTVRRQSIRAPHFEYAEPGAYFVTICVVGVGRVFGAIRGGEMTLNPFGRIVDECWRAIPDHCADVVIDEHIVMPDHFHGIVIIGDRRHGSDRRGTAYRAPGERTDGGGLTWGTACRAPTDDRREHGLPPRQFGGSRSRTLSSIIGSFKSAVTRRIHAAGGCRGRSVWQRDYYERVIRDDAAMKRIREYIATNVDRWIEKHGDNPPVGTTHASPRVDKPTTVDRHGARHASPRRGMRDRNDHPGGVAQ